jgi:hypothetical protein
VFSTIDPSASPGAAALSAVNGRFSDALVLDKKIYFLPYAENNLLVLEPENNNTLSTIAVQTPDMAIRNVSMYPFAYAGGVAMGNKVHTHM